jgi:hypothetical protein
MKQAVQKVGRPLSAIARSVPGTEASQMSIINRLFFFTTRIFAWNSIRLQASAVYWQWDARVQGLDRGLSAVTKPLVIIQYPKQRGLVRSGLKLLPAPLP